MNLAFAVAAALSALIWGVHTFLGTAEVRPVLEADPPHDGAAKTLAYAWHVVTVALALTAGGFAYAAYTPAGWDVAAFLTVLCGAWAALSLGMTLHARLAWDALPQWTLFALVALAGAVGLRG